MEEHVKSFNIYLTYLQIINNAFHIISDKLYCLMHRIKIDLNNAFKVMPVNKKLSAFLTISNNLKKSKITEIIY